MLVLLFCQTSRTSLLTMQGAVLGALAALFLSFWWGLGSVVAGTTPPVLPLSTVGCPHINSIYPRYYDVTIYDDELHFAWSDDDVESCVWHRTYHSWIYSRLAGMAFLFWWYFSRSSFDLHLTLIFISALVCLLWGNSVESNIIVTYSL